MNLWLARPFNGRTEHLMRDEDTETLCGRDARLMSKFKPADRGGDAKIRPLCNSCREAKEALPMSHYEENRSGLDRAAMIAVLRRVGWADEEFSVMDDADLSAEIPELRNPGGYRGGYRLWDRNRCRYGDLDVALVTTSGWGVSYSILDLILSSPGVVAAHDGKVELRAYRVPVGSITDYHELHGTRYDDKDAATRAAFDAGLLAYMTYEEDR